MSDSYSNSSRTCFDAPQIFKNRIFLPENNTIEREREGDMDEGNIEKENEFIYISITMDYFHEMLGCI